MAANPLADAEESTESTELNELNAGAAKFQDPVLRLVLAGRWDEVAPMLKGKSKEETPRIRDDNHFTVLHHAAKDGQLDVARYLIETLASTSTNTTVSAAHHCVSLRRCIFRADVLTRRARAIASDRAVGFGQQTPFTTLSTAARPDAHQHERRLAVPQLNVGESSRAAVLLLPRARRRHTT